MSKLSKDQMEDLKNLMRHSNWGLLAMLLEQIIAHHVNKLLAYNLSDGPEGLVILKAQVEGMYKLQAELVQYRDKMSNG